MQLLRPKNLFVLLIAGGLAIAAFAQELKHPTDKLRPRKAVNLKVLSPAISHDSLMTVMHTWENSLGVNCAFCHAPSKEGGGHLDFASDNNRKKEIARHMYTMTDSINHQYFSWWNPAKESRAMAVSCYTCHHGHSEPEGMMGGGEEKK